MVLYYWFDLIADCLFFQNDFIEPKMSNCKSLNSYNCKIFMCCLLPHVKCYHICYNCFLTVFLVKAVCLLHSSCMCCLIDKSCTLELNEKTHFQPCCMKLSSTPFTLCTLSVDDNYTKVSLL